MLGRSLIDIDNLEDHHISDIIDLAQVFKKYSKDGAIHRLVDSTKAGRKLVYLFFTEPSTRTRVSFETACDRLGVKTIYLSAGRSSVAKGETVEDTINILKALKPDALIFRSKKLKIPMEDLLVGSIPLINAGLGTQSHPSQSLSDALTILENRGQIKGERVLIVGDVLHSRVAHSNVKLLSRLGAEVAYCSPKGLAPRNEVWKNFKNFDELNEGVKWATVLVSLRVQEERHGDLLGSIGFSVAEYRDKFRIGYDQVNIFSPEGIILHPGPAIRGVEISNFALRDSRCRILNQVENGLYVRLALLSLILDLKV